VAGELVYEDPHFQPFFEHEFLPLRDENPSTSLLSLRKGRDKNTISDRS
jgi:hypothetical protein